MLERDALIVGLTSGGCPFSEAEVLVSAFERAWAERIRAAAAGDDADNSWVVNAYDAARMIERRPDEESTP